MPGTRPGRHCPAAVEPPQRTRAAAGCWAHPPPRRRHMATSPRDTYVTGLVNAHALEEQAISLLSRQAERLETYPEMLQQIQLHIEESRRQASRLEEILQNLGTSHSSLKDMATKFTGNMAAMAH